MEGQVRLSASLIRLLTLFVTQAGELVTREQITICLWREPQYVDATTGINTAVNRLRAALDNDDPTAPIYIATVIGLGYRFIASVEKPLQVEAGQKAAQEQSSNLHGLPSPTGPEQNSGADAVARLPAAVTPEVSPLSYQQRSRMEALDRTCRSFLRLCSQSHLHVEGFCDEATASRI